MTGAKSTDLTTRTILALSITKPSRTECAGLSDAVFVCALWGLHESLPYPRDHEPPQLSPTPAQRDVTWWRGRWPPSERSAPTRCRGLMMEVHLPGYQPLKSQVLRGGNWTFPHWPGANSLRVTWPTPLKRLLRADLSFNCQGHGALPQGRSSIDGLCNAASLGDIRDH